MFSKRIKKIAKLIPPGKVVADIGTDHAYLPIYLLRNTLVPRVIAVELNSGPLKSAEETVKKYGFQDKVDIRSGSGLKPLKLKEVEAVIIAGMGGDTINSILADSLEIARNMQRLIIQPMNKVNLVRSFLQSHQFRLIDEELVYEDNRYYEILVAKPGDSFEYDELILEIGPILLSKRHSLLVDYLEEKIQHYRRVIAELERSSNIGAQEKKKYYEGKVIYLEKVISCLLDVPK